MKKTSVLCALLFVAVCAKAQGVPTNGSPGENSTANSEARIQTLEQQVSMLAEQVALLRGQLKVLADAKKQIVTVTIRVNVERAAVTVDGRVLGESPIKGEVYIDAGDHVIVASAPDFPPAQEKLHAEKGGASLILLTLAKPGTGPNNGGGFVLLDDRRALDAGPDGQRVAIVYVALDIAVAFGEMGHATTFRFGRCAIRQTQRR